MSHPRLDEYGGGQLEQPGRLGSLRRARAGGYCEDHDVRHLHRDGRSETTVAGIIVGNALPLAGVQQFIVRAGVTLTATAPITVNDNGTFTVENGETIILGKPRSALPVRTGDKLREHRLDQQRYLSL